MLTTYTAERGRSFPSTVPQPRDSQRSKVYAWERSQGFYDRSVRTEPATIQRVFDQVWALYGRGLPKPGLKFSPNKRNCCFNYSYSGDINVIQINYTYCKIEAILHEAAHAILWQRFGPTLQSHGPEFVGLYIDMLYTVMGKDDGELMASARAMGVAVIPIERIKF
jgi:hypothetical protein